MPALQPSLKDIRVVLYGATGAPIFTSQAASFDLSLPANAGFFFGFLQGTPDYNAFTTALGSAATLGLNEITTNDVAAGNTWTFSVAQGVGSAVTTPEPDTWMLAGTGLLAIFGVVRTRRRRGGAPA